MPTVAKQTFSNPYKYAISRSKIAMSFDYVFGKGTSKKLDFETIDFQYSRRTGRLRYVINRESKEILFTLRANGSIAPTVSGARFILGHRIGKKSRPRWVITVINDVSEFVANGKTVFCKHVTACDEELLAGEDVAVSNQRGELLAVGKTVVPASLMKQFKRGVAVKVREGINVNGSPTVL